MSRLYTIVVVIFLLISVGGFISYKWNEITDLKENVEQLETTQENVDLHFSRETERLEAINELTNKKGILQYEASKDVSDGDFTFSASRVRRINEIR